MTNAIFTVDGARNGVFSGEILLENNGIIVKGPGVFKAKDLIQLGKAAIPVVFKRKDFFEDLENAVTDKQVIRNLQKDGVFRLQ